MAHEYPSERPNTEFDELLKEFRHEVGLISGGMVEADPEDLVKLLAFNEMVKRRNKEALRKERSKNI